VTILVIVNDSSEKQEFIARATWTPRWIYRSGQSAGDDTLLESALSDIVLPPGEGYIWIAAEARIARAVRRYVSESLGHPKHWLKASGYWSKGTVATHEAIQD
jgi:NADPH-dependent ferric siderophore reductase